MTDLYVYAGPSLGALGEVDLPATVLPPVGRGQVAELLGGGGRPGIIVVVDGCVDRRLAVGHRELCAALDAGWQVWGLGGIGAIRAYELRNEGMRGFGGVYQRLRTRSDFRDDEVMHLHHPQPPYAAHSVALIHLQEALSSLQRRSAVEPAAARWVLGRLRPMWYGERTLAHFVTLLRNCQPAVAEADIHALCDRFDRFDPKSRDLSRFLSQRPWQESYARRAGRGHA